jgi:hypothetical protein
VPQRRPDVIVKGDPHPEIPEFPQRRRHGGIVLKNDIFGNLEFQCVDAEDAAIVRAIICLSQSFGLDVIAEGIETAEQEAMQRELGCVHGLGYLCGRPMPQKEMPTDRQRGLLSGSFPVGLSAPNTPV